MILARNAEGARLIGNYGVLGKSLNRLVVCVGGVSEDLKHIVQEGSENTGYQLPDMNE
ncbi:hypothetical protein [Lysinibacillus sp. NPDC096259]|uniref:hypothetical protein n=1 Tax=Lysinibacillus sp. NPDC096259 TaxID=3390583 RepID=UPI003D00790D